MGSTETPDRLRHSRMRNHHDAKVHNEAMQQELHYVLKTIDTIKIKAKQGRDFEQKKFLKSMSITGETVEGDDKTSPKAVQRENTLPVLSVSHAKDHAYMADQKVRFAFPRSSSNIDLDHMTMGSRDRSTLDHMGMESRERSNSFKVVSESPFCNQYPISSNMKISDTKGSFEIITGKEGLKAWVGKTNRRYPAFQIRKVIR